MKNNKNIIIFLLGLATYLILSFFIQDYDTLFHPKVFYKLVFTALIFLIYYEKKNVIYQIERITTLIIISFSLFLAIGLNTGLVCWNSNNYTHDLVFKSIFVISTGFFEETLFRFLLFFGLLNYFDRYDFKKILQIAIITSIIFGLIHGFNAFKGTHLFQSTVNQIIIAFGLGFLMQSLFLRYKSLLIVSILHAVINFVGTLNTLISNNETVENIAPINYWEFNWASFIFVVIFTSFSVIIGYLVFPKKKEFRNFFINLIQT